MKNKAGVFVVAAVVLVVAGAVYLGGRSPGAADGAPPARSPTPIPTETTGILSGEIRFEGALPRPRMVVMSGNAECGMLHSDPVPENDVLVKDGKLQNAFVYIQKGLEKYVFAVPESAVTIDQSGCLYAPRVSGARVDQKIVFQNSDPTLHNIHSRPQASREWNFPLSGKGTQREIRVPAPEVMIPLMCDLHPWMKGFLGVVDHPFFQVTGADGRFSFDGVPAGEYAVEAWHERFGKQSGTVKVEPKKKAELVLTFRP